MIFSLFGCGKKTKEATFWEWFMANEEMLLNFDDSNQEAVFNQLSYEMSKVHPDLTFEFSSLMDNGTKEFIISAGGIKAAFPSVESLYKLAPKSEKWVFIKYRPRRKPMSVEFAGKEIHPNNINAQLFKDGEKVGIMLFIKGYEESQSNIYEQIGFLFLDQALGEYDIETKVGFIEFTDQDSKYFTNSFSLLQLSSRFDEYINNK